jgi:ribosomal-protein-alanine N-acetyltransferase
LFHGTNLAIVTQSFVLNHGDVNVRLVRVKDAKKLGQLILGNREWLRPWEATNPHGPNSFDIKGQVRGLLKQFKDDQGFPFVIEHRGEIVGQLNVSNVLFGSVSSALIGYWISPRFAGKEITPTAVALVIDYLLNIVGLHRVEIDIRPENTASLRIVEKLGMRYEGLKERFIHINGDWRDHFVFAVTHEEVPDGILNRWKQNSVPPIEYPWKNS